MDMGTVTLPLNRYTYQWIAREYSAAERGSVSSARYLNLLTEFETALKEGRILKRSISLRREISFPAM